jgi:hypothetical protein
MDGRVQPCVTACVGLPRGAGDDASPIGRQVDPAIQVGVAGNARAEVAELVPVVVEPPPGGAFVGGTEDPEYSADRAGKVDRLVVGAGAALPKPTPCAV